MCVIVWVHHTFTLMRCYPTRNLIVVLVAQSCPTPCNPMDCSPSGSFIHGILQTRNTGVGSHSLFQGIFLTQGLNLGRLHCRSILYCLSHQGIFISLTPLVNTLCGSPLDLTVIAIKANIFLASNPNRVISKK